MRIELPHVITSQDQTYEALRPAIRAGDVSRFRRGGYLWLNPELARWQQRRALVLARCVAVAARYTTRFAFSHDTAAVLLGWAVTLIDDHVHITQTVNPGGSSTADVIRHVRPDLPDGDVTYVEGLPVTTPERTVLDCARFLPPDRGMVVVDGALRQLARVSVHRWDESVERQERLRSQVLARLAALGPVPGSVRARAVITAASGFADGPPESRLRWIALTGGLPDPTPQHPLRIGARNLFTDLGWTGECSDGTWLVVAEFDGAVKYAKDEHDPTRAAQVVVAEKEREDLIRRRGAQIVRFERFTTADLRDARAVASRLRCAFPVPIGVTPRPALQLPPGRRRSRT